MKKSKKKVTKAQNGYPNAWEMQGNGMYQYSQGYYPQMNYFGQNPQITQENQIFPQSEMQIQPIQQSQQLQQPSQQKVPGMGGMAAGIGRGIGQAMSAFAIGAPQLINALLPEDNRFREDMTIPRALNRYPQGTGSQAIYEYGGEVAKNGYRTRKRRQNNIQITEEIPLEDNLQPLPQRGYVDRAFSFKPQPVNLPPIPEQRDISFQRMLDVHGQPTAYLPQFQGYSYNEAAQALPQLPESFGGVPVVRSPQNYLDFFQGFLPGTQASQWTPYDTGDYTPLPLTPFEYGGEIEAKSGIYIKPSKRGSLRKALGVKEGENIPASKLKIKESDSPAMKKKKQFAINAKKFKHEFGGIVEGAEMDLSADQIQQLLDNGYEIDILS